MTRKAQKIMNKEEICEDWCFECKDGGCLYICEYGDCLKAYHAECVGKDELFFENGGRLTCKWHSCYKCQKRSKFQCFCCTKAVCQRCPADAEFARLRGTKGFCCDCLKLALLVEENKEADSEGDRVDFQDRNTVEGLFSEYWLIVKEKESLSLEDLRFVDVQLKKGENQRSISNPSESDRNESNFEEDMDELTPIQKGKRSRGHKASMKTEVKSKKREFVGWGSKALIDFLESIGKDTTNELSQFDVTSIINGYINENRLFSPEKKKKIFCDERLKTLLGKKTVNRNKIHDLLEFHFLENVKFLEEEEEKLGFCSEDKDESTLMACKQQKKTCRKPQEKEAVLAAPQSCFASIVPENIKRVYLKRCLVIELLKQPETFESKVTGSFIKVKSDPYDCFSRNTHQLVQVTGVKNFSAGGNKEDILLQVSYSSNEIRISMLSDNNFSEEECEDLRQKVKCGQLKKLTIVEMEEKAKSLHELVTKHWIVKELSLLQTRIDQANEKGWRAELFDYLERRRLLQTDAEQLRLLEEVPKIIAEEVEVVPISNDAIKESKHGDNISPKSTVTGNSETPCRNWGASIISSGDKAVTSGNSLGNTGSSSASYGKTQGNKTENNIQEEEEEEYDGDVSTPEHNFMSEGELSCEESQTISEENRKNSKLSVCEKQFDAILQTEPHPSRSQISGGKQSQIGDAEQKVEKIEEKPSVEIIESSSDEDSGDSSRAAHRKKKIIESDVKIWECVGPNGEKKGPHSLSLLKRWGETSTFALKFKVWKTYESEDTAIPLSDVVRQFYPGPPRYL